MVASLIPLYRKRPGTAGFPRDDTGENEIQWRSAMAVERSNPSALANPPGYSHVVKDGKTIYVAGQLSRNSAGETVGEGNFSAQAEQAFNGMDCSVMDRY